MRRFLPFIILLLFLVLSALGGFLFYKSRIYKSLIPKTDENSQTNLESLGAPNLPGNPINKLYPQDNSGVLYEIKGKFVGNIVPMEGNSSGIYKGEFVIEGDPLNRKINTWLESTSILGIYKDSFNSNSNWKSVSASEISSQVRPDETVKLEVDYSLPKGETIPAYVVDAEKILDSLIQEFNQKQFKYEIPNNFYIIANGIGIIR